MSMLNKNVEEVEFLEALGFVRDEWDDDVGKKFTSIRNKVYKTAKETAKKPVEIVKKTVKGTVKDMNGIAKDIVNGLNVKDSEIKGILNQIRNINP